MIKPKDYPFTETCPVCNGKMARGNDVCSMACYEKWVDKNKEEEEE